MAKIKRSLVGLLLVIFSAACALDGTKSGVSLPAAPVPDPVVSPMDDAMLELRTFQEMTPTALYTAKEAARDAFERDPSPFRRQRYVFALFVSPANAADDVRLVTLIEPLVASAGDRDAVSRVLAQLISHTAITRKKLREEILALRFRQANVYPAARRDDRETEMRSLRVRVDALESQLAAIKSIDRSVTRR